jgi:hypothetical protein
MAEGNEANKTCLLIETLLAFFSPLCFTFNHLNFNNKLSVYPATVCHTLCETGSQTERKKTENRKLERKSDIFGSFRFEKWILTHALKWKHGKKCNSRIHKYLFALLKKEWVEGRQNLFSTTKIRSSSWFVNFFVVVPGNCWLNIETNNGSCSLLSQWWLILRPKIPYGKAFR